MNNLANYITINRRYSRSVNLERDSLEADSVLGYVPTAKSAETIERIILKKSLTVDEIQASRPEVEHTDQSEEMADMAIELPMAGFKLLLKSQWPLALRFMKLLPFKKDCLTKKEQFINLSN